MPAKSFTISLGDVLTVTGELLEISMASPART
jgi:hypothetical protein